MNDVSEIAEGLMRHASLCREILVVIEAETRALDDSESKVQFELYQKKKALLSRLSDSLQNVKRCRERWQQLPATEQAAAGDARRLMRENQDIIMKAIVLDRENEQALLRRGMVPHRQIPSINRQRPHFVAELYRRNGV